MNKEFLANMTIDESIEYLFKTHFATKSILNNEMYNELGLIHSFPKTAWDILTKMLAYDIITYSGGNEYRLTNKGYKVLELGGWGNYIKHLKQIEDKKKSDRQLAREVNESAKLTNESVIKIQRMQTYILVIAGVAAVVSAIGTFGQWRIAAEQQQQTDKVSQGLKPKSNYLSPLCQDTTCATLADTATIKKILSK